VRPEDQYHVGIVVDDHERACAELTRLFGYRWCEDLVFTLPVHFGGGVQDVELRFAYSMDAPHLEVVRAVPGTPWEPAEGSGIHHLGYWSDDIAADSAALEAEGFPREAAGLGPDGVPMFAYHRHPTGPRIELVPSASRPMMEQYFATGKAPF
jgi:hypothetical protein